MTVSTPAARYVGLPGRTLTRPELAALVAGVRAAPAEWRPHIDDIAGGDSRYYECLYRDDHVDVWVLSWTARADTGWHDHDLSSGAVAVAQGRLVEHVLTLGAAPISREVAAGDGVDFGPDHIHRLGGLVDGSISIHAYSPPLERLGQYTVGPDAALHRSVISYTEELGAVPA